MQLIAVVFPEPVSYTHLDVYKRQAITIVGEEKDGSGATWYKIEYDGGSGYMHSDYITVIVVVITTNGNIIRMHIT